jgi:hypothetical protein
MACSGTALPSFNIHPTTRLLTLLSIFLSLLSFLFSLFLPAFLVVVQKVIKLLTYW